MNQVWMQITSGKGPVECAWAVMKVLAKIEQEAAASSLECKVIEMAPGPLPGTALSALLSICGEATVDFTQSWRGTVQWIANSPFRPAHKRKNWFVGVEVLTPVDEAGFDLKEVRWETMRATGPGGQHVNRTESAVRVTHPPTGMQATAMEERSQLRNRKLALARLARKLDELAASREGAAREQRWRVHQELERGNPVRVFRGTG